eukprot:CAMPEP_0183498102 /NCGR_PEP_ID=MMETSP0371-20130417/484_1 /TAXON_ID=268820 /ORGANISM="Peridinium aciculiferum, Strain PAER-2" /LENGTH=57 /DNA_ID=CAMNT_0025691555 /DNA_START=1 /DNA_END=174 /DNA_ORIENTATION=+
MLPVESESEEESSSESDVQEEPVKPVGEELLLQQRRVMEDLLAAHQLLADECREWVM